MGVCRNLLVALLALESVSLGSVLQPSSVLNGDGISRLRDCTSTLLQDMLCDTHDDVCARKVSVLELCVGWNSWS